MAIISAQLVPSESRPSIRIDRLPIEALDICAWIFDQGIPANPIVPMPTNTIEVRLDDPVHNLLYGDGTVCMHAGSDGDSYMKHLDDEDWAVVYQHDCPGDAERGAEVIERRKTS